MSFYENAAQTSAILIAKRGLEFVFTRVTGASIDPVTGVKTPGISVEFKPRGIYKRISKDDLIGSTLIQQGDKLLIIDDTFRPMLSDTVLIEGASWNIIDVTPVNPGGIDIIYYVHVRR